MSKTKKQTFFGIILSLIMLVSMGSFATVAYATTASDASTFAISGNYDKAKNVTSPIKTNCTYQFKFGNTWHADSLSSIMTATGSSSCSVVAKWTAKTNVVKTKNGSGTTGASATCYGIVGTSTKNTYHQFISKSSSHSYTFIATGSR